VIVIEGAVASVVARRNGSLHMLRVAFGDFICSENGDCIAWIIFVNDESFRVQCLIHGLLSASNLVVVAFWFIDVSRGFVSAFCRIVRLMGC
jgi:hypothetical protein